VRLRSALCALLIVAFASAAGAAPQKTTVTDFGAAKFYAQSDDTAFLAGVQLFVRAGLDRQDSQHDGIAALAAETIVRTPVDGTPVRDLISARGGSLSYNLGPQDVRFYLEAAPGSMAALAALVAKAIAAPDTTNATVAAARRAVLTRITDDERNPVNVGLTMLRRSYYDGSAGLPTFGTSGTVANMSGADIGAFIAAHYRRGNAVISAVGHVTDDVTSAARALASALPEGGEAPVVSKSHPFAVSPKRIVAQRDIGVTYAVLGFAAPAAGDADFGAMLIVRSLLSDIFDRASATSLPSYSRAVGVIYNYDTKPASLSLYINGALLSPATGLASLDTVLHNISDQPMKPALFKRYKTSAHGEWETESVSLEDRAWSIGNFVELGTGPDYAQTALAAVDAATPESVQRVAKQYLQRFTLALIRPRDTP
jgi:predicted Zn-dependent peptidase